MALYADRVKQSLGVTGTGTVTLTLATTGNGYQSFLTAFGTGTQTVAYCIADQTGPNWEVGTGSYNGSANTLARTTVLASSNGGSLTNFSGGTQDVFCTAPAKYLDTFTDTNQGVVPASGGGTSNFLRADGTFAAPTATAPASPTTSVQFNNAGAFGGSANFTYVSGTNTVSFGNLTGSATSMTIQPLAPTSGSAGALTVQARAGVATNGAGGAVNLTAGAGVGSGVGGALNLTAGNAVSGVAGAMTFNAGDSSFSTGGALTFNAGDSASAANGGAINFNAGTGYAGGSMTFTAGAATGAAAGAVGGSMSFTAGNSSSAANAGDLTFSAGSSGAGSFSGFRGGNLSFSSGSSDFGPAGSFSCATGVGATNSGAVIFETGFASGGTSGNISFTTGAGGFSTAGNAGNLIYTGGQTGNDDDDYSGTGGGVVFTGGYGYGSAGVGGSFTFTAGGGNATQGSINLATVSGTSIQLADSSGARQLGFFGVTPVVKPAPTASGTGNVLSSVVIALNSLGLVSSASLTNASTLTAAGSNTQIQFNNSNAFGASANFTYATATNTFTVGPAGATTIIETLAPTGATVAGTLRLLGKNASATNGNGGSLQLVGGNSLGTGTAGGLSVTGGSGRTGGSVGMTSGAGTVDGGNFAFNAGQGTSGSGGGFQIAAGFGATGTAVGGSFDMAAGNAGGSGDGGGFVLTAGSSTSGLGGNLTFLPGSGTTSGITYLLDSIGNAVVQITDDTSSPQLGFFNTTPVAQAAAYTKTYSTASRTIPNATFTNLVTTAATNVAPYGFTTQAQADAIATKTNALAADVLILKQLIVSLVNDSSTTLGVGLNAT
jgi:hypothetical protein